MAKGRIKPADLAAAREVYDDLGPLSEPEMKRLRNMGEDYTRRGYIRSIYGRYAGDVAWMEYLKWLKRQEQKEQQR